ncbi:MAG: aminopeptidase N [Pseudomonadota bacterium]
MRTTTAPTIRLKDYTPPAYLIDTVNMLVRLSPDGTEVVTTTIVRRAKGTKVGTPLVWDGDELALQAITLDGQPLDDHHYTATADQLTLHTPPKAKTFELTITTRLAPKTNTKLMGLYQSNGVYCTQCEAEGFRRITYFADRPDVLAVYTVRVEGDGQECPILLSNGNPVESGKLADGRHFATWHDPHPKPSYLFALVGGKLDAFSDTFTTASGKEVALNIYVEPGKAPKAAYAMDSLKRSMVWDEQVYGREYDLDVFNIVAVSDFNMGAMENKGLNVFNDKYVLADEDTATDADFANIEAIIAHEYFHNWTGNRITCRDWFQLCLKEGLTVYRDQEFSADQRSRPVQRIQQVRVLKAGQFTEDAGPLAHSVRPAAYKEINNFYTATVYQKGAELVRMLATIVGAKAYRKSTDLYFKRHDGEAARVEDWLGSFEKAAEVDLTQFARWYGQAGTPEVTVAESYDKAKRRYSLTLSQSVPPTPGQKTKKVVPIPLRFGLIDRSGNDMAASSKSAMVRDDVILLDRKNATIHFDEVDHKPVLSILRGFSAPVNLAHRQSAKGRLHRGRYDTDAYNRWEALNGLTLQELVKGSKKRAKGEKALLDEDLLTALAETAFDETLEPAFRAQVLSLPNSQNVAQALGRNVDPDAIFAMVKDAQKALGKQLGREGLTLWQRLVEEQAEADDLAAAGLRSLANTLLPLLTLAKIGDAVGQAEHQFDTATNMTNRMAGLSTLIYAQSDRKKADAALDKFYKRYADNPLVIDKWFAIQAALPGSAGLTRVKQLSKHAAYSLENPNRARALLAPFAAGNLSGFHRADGKAYAFYAQQIVAIDAINPQLAARLLTLMNVWRSMEKGRAGHAKAALQSIATHPNLSRDVKEIVDRALA